MAFVSSGFKSVRVDNLGEIAVCIDALFKQFKPVASLALNHVDWIEVDFKRLLLVVEDFEL